jgi:hypothetical protein
MSVLDLGSDDELDDDDEPSPSRRVCVGCGVSAPPTRTAHTLISSKHGWRLERIAESEGAHRYDWRCPKCWLLHRAASRPRT